MWQICEKFKLCCVVAGYISTGVSVTHTIRKGQLKASPELSTQLSSTVS